MHARVLAFCSMLAAVLQRHPKLRVVRFGDRILFGSDKQPIAKILERLDAVEWLTPAQRRAILYDNAARFLRLAPETIAEHHRKARARGGRAEGRSVAPARGAAPPKRR